MDLDLINGQNTYGNSNQKIVGFTFAYKKYQQNSKKFNRKNS